MSEYVCDPLVDIINSLFSTGVYPDHFKIGKIIALFKKGSKLDPKNYRPITLLSAFSKVLERILVLRLMSYFTNYGLLAHCQYAYQCGKSVQLAIFNLLCAIYDSLEKFHHNVGIFDDYSKAFDCIVPVELAPNLEDMGIIDTLLALIISYLTNYSLFV